MKRGPGPKRTTPLRSDPQRAREWEQRARSKGLAPRALVDMPPGPTRGRRKHPRPAPSVAPTSARQAARARSAGKCVVCLHLGRPQPRKAEHLHHVLPKGLARFSKWAADSRNLVGVCRQCHDRHTNCSMVRQRDGSLRDGRIPFEALPDAVVQFVAQAGAAAVDYVAQHYPRADAGRNPA